MIVSAIDAHSGIGLAPHPERIAGLVESERHRARRLGIEDGSLNCNSITSVHDALNIVSGLAFETSVTRRGCRSAARLSCRTQVPPHDR
jgi:hypothetical protein